MIYDNNLQALKLPSLKVKRNQRLDGTFRTSVSAQGKVVGHVDDEFGPVTFKPEFLERFPQLNGQTVVLRPNQYNNDCWSYFAAGSKQIAQVLKAWQDRKSAPRPVGATLLLAQVAHATGLSAILEQITAEVPEYAACIFALGNGILQNNNANYELLPALARERILGTPESLIHPSKVNSLLSLIMHYELRERFCQAWLQQKLSAELATKRYSSFTFWVHESPNNYNLLFLSANDDGQIYYCTKLAEELPDQLETPQDYAKARAHLEQVMRHALPQGALPQSQPLPWPLICHYHDTDLSDPALKQAVHLGLELNFKVKPTGKHYQHYLDYASDARLKAAEKIASNWLHTVHLELPAKLSVKLAAPGTTPKPLHLHLYYQADQYQERYHQIYQEVADKAELMNRKVILCISPDNLWLQDPKTKLWSPNEAACRHIARKSLTRVHATTLPLDSTTALHSLIYGEHMSDYLLELQEAQKVDYKPDTPGLMIHLFALVLMQALTARIEGALKGAYGRKPSYQEAQRMSNLPLLLEHLNDITGKWEDGKLTLTALSAEQRTIFELLGFKLDDQLSRTWDEWCHLGSPTN